MKALTTIFKKNLQNQKKRKNNFSRLRTFDFTCNISIFISDTNGSDTHSG